MEKIRPKIIVLAIGPQTTDVPPKPIAVGMSPAIVVTEVRRIGLNLVCADSTTDSFTDTPCFRLSFIKLIRTIASLTAIPARATPE